MRLNKKAWLIKLGIMSVLWNGTMSCSENQEPIIEEKPIEYQLVYDEEFDGDSYDTKYWSSYQTQSWSSAWNHYVMPDESALAEVKDGHLYLRARWNTVTDLPETGAIQTKGKFSFKYGKIEVKAKFTSAGQGGWPAIWLMPQNAMYSGWPNGGEIDIMEHLNTDNFVHQVVHQSNGEAVHISTGKKPAISTLDYNTYGIVKLPNKIEFYVNNVLTMVHEPKGDFKKRWPFETDFYLILNHACADKGQSGINYWPGNVTNTDNFPYEMAIDYIRVWKLKE